MALGGSSNGDNTNEGNFQASTQIKVVRRIVTHPQARVTRGFVQNDLVRVDLPLMRGHLDMYFSLKLNLVSLNFQSKIFKIELICAIR